MTHSASLIEDATPAPAALTRRLPTLDRLALFLDFDGTLAPIAERPDGVTAEPRRSAILRRLGERLDGRVALLTGRPLDLADELTDGTVTTIAALHGLDLRGADGRVERAAPAAGLDRVRGELARFVSDNPGALVEDKGASVALHYREAPAAAAAARTLTSRLAEATALTLQPGDKVFELKTPGRDKGEALAAIMSTEPFAGAVPVMVGDDLTDEPAFAEAERRGGFGVVVGTRTPTRATMRLADVSETLAWLERLGAQT